MKEPLIEVKNLTKTFTVNRKKIHAVRDISFTIAHGETLGLVGESGCGKSTTGRCLLRLEEPTSGEILHNAQNLLTLTRQRALRLPPQRPDHLPGPLLLP